jgi:hypothetical protein
VQIKSVKITEDGGGAGGRSARSGNAKPEQVTYQTELSGDLNGIIKYIDMIEKNPRFMLVNSFSLKPGKVAIDKESDGRFAFGHHEVKMNIITYVYNPGGEVAR